MLPVDAQVAPRHRERLTGERLRLVILTWSSRLIRISVGKEVLMASKLLCRRQWFALVLVVGCLMLWSSAPAHAAGCHTDCTLTVKPDCLGCGFVAFSNIFCLRAGCDTCYEDSCSDIVMQGGKSASSNKEVCPASTPRLAPSLRVIKVQELPSRG